ncbi:MAG: cytochrome c [Xanthomonadales bacterium]|nr:cytochrome c [Xanthomonadales bacterium]
MKHRAFSVAAALRYTSLALLLAMPLTAAAAGDPAKGKEKSATCQACHGEDGRTVIDPSYPILAGQYASYLVRALQDYRSGERSNAVMAGMSANLSDQDIEDLAAWYASREGLRDLSIK